ncbi:MAG: LapA family protein [Mariprofundaceae bacterium]|nr:LapA family protein [Mariprofundaceae bacterium]
MNLPTLYKKLWQWIDHAHFKKNYVYWLNTLGAIIVTVVATVFVISNKHLVYVAFANHTSSYMPLYWPLCCAFLSGFLGGLLAMSFSRSKHKKTITFFRQENERLKKEVNNLRNLPLQD